MKQVKYELCDLSLYDYQYIEQHLVEMSEKGWHLENINHFLWKYRRGEERAVRYAVTYAPKASAYNSYPTESEESLAEICAGAGWQRIGALAQLQVFRNDDPDAVPLETDERQRFSTMRKSMLRHFVPAQALMILLFLVSLGMQVSTLMQYPCRSLSTPFLFCGIGMLLTIILIYTVQLCASLLWVRRARKAVEAGLSCPTDRFYRKFRFVLWGVIFVYLLLLLYCTELQLVVRIIVTALLNIVVVFGLIHMCKSLGAPKWANILVPVLGGTLLLMLLTPAVLSILDIAIPHREPERECPLLLSDLMDTSDLETDSLVIEEQVSPAVRYGRYVDTVSAGSGSPRIQYTIVDVSWDMFYDACLHEQEQLFMRSAQYQPDETTILYQMELWDAHYARHISNGDSNRWLICWEDRIVTLYTNWDLTQEQIEHIKEILMP